MVIITYPSQYNVRSCHNLRDNKLHNIKLVIKTKKNVIEIFKSILSNAKINKFTKHI